MQTYLYAYPMCWFKQYIIMKKPLPEKRFLKKLNSDLIVCLAFERIKETGRCDFLLQDFSYLELGLKNDKLHFLWNMDCFNF